MVHIATITQHKLVTRADKKVTVNKATFQMSQKKNNFQIRLMLQFKKDNLNQPYRMNFKNFYQKLLLDNNFQLKIVRLL